MINFRFILLGALVGILSTIGFQELSNRMGPSYPGFDPSYKAPVTETAESPASGRYPGVSAQAVWHEDYLVVPREHLFQKGSDPERSAVNPAMLNTNMTAADRGREDSGFEGWDQRLIMANDTEYFYGKENGFPVYIKSASNEVVRIDGSYHDLYQLEDKKFVIKDGDKLEVDFSDLDQLRLTPLPDRESDGDEQEYTAFDLQNYPTEPTSPDIEPLAAPLTQELDDRLLKEGILPPKATEPKRHRRARPFASPAPARI